MRCRRTKYGKYVKWRDEMACVAAMKHLHCVASMHLCSSPPQAQAEVRIPPRISRKGVVTALRVKTCHARLCSVTSLIHMSTSSSSSDVQGPVHDEAWEEERREESKQLQRMRQEAAKEEQMKVEEYRRDAMKLKKFPVESVKKAKKFVASLILAGEEVEEMIVEAAKNGDLSPMVLLVIKYRLELAQREGEKDAMQALDLLYRRIENEMLQKEASLELQFLNELLNLHDGFSHEEWLQRARRCMLDIFVPENAFTILAPPGFDPKNKIGPVDIPEQDDVLLRVDFLREVDQLIQELESHSQSKTVEGFDAQSVAIRFRQDERKRALQYVKDIQHLAATLKW